MTPKPVVLVVDDDADLRNALVTMLGHEGHTAVEAANGLDALDSLESQEPHLVVLDLQMPIMDGRTFLEHKAKTRHADTPVIVFSSCPPGELEATAGVAAVVPKLSGVEALRDALERVAQESPMQATDTAKDVRGATDESLQAERDRTDDELARKRDVIEEKADAVVDRARTAADSVLQTARETADAKRGARNLQLVKEERTRADVLVVTERAAADDCLREERQQRKSALATLLRLEREDTDTHLLTERGHADDALNTRDIFLAMVSHDLRNMLGGIAMSAALLAQDAPAEVDIPTSIRARAALIQRFAARMNRLVCDLVDVASIESGKLVVETRSDDLSSLIRESVELFQPSASERGLSLEMTRDQEPMIARFDRERIIQVVANLISNAIKFTPKGGRVELRVEQRGGEVLVSVADDGIGVPADDLETIFGRFSQVGTGNRTGLGLGLFISRCVVEAHGGRIWAERIATRGSKFVFSLPAARGYRSEAR